jgi:uncharacterized protein
LTMLINKEVKSQSQYFTDLRSSSEHPQDPYIHTQSGRFYIERPVWIPEAMAHSMAQTARYRGNADEFYSVAEHSVLVAALMRDVVGGSPWEGILHDAAESVLPDVSSPFKQLLPDLRKIEKDLDKDIRQHFGLPLSKTKEATIADWLALFIEAAELIPERGADFVDPYELRQEALKLREQKGWRVARLGWKEAKKLWLDAYHEFRP